MARVPWKCSQLFIRHMIKYTSSYNSPDLQALSLYWFYNVSHILFHMSFLMTAVSSYYDLWISCSASKYNKNVCTVGEAVRMWHNYMILLRFTAVCDKQEGLWNNTGTVPCLFPKKWDNVCLVHFKILGKNTLISAAQWCSG